MPVTIHFRKLTPGQGTVEEIETELYEATKTNVHYQRILANSRTRLKIIETVLKYSENAAAPYQELSDPRVTLRYRNRWSNRMLAVEVVESIADRLLVLDEDPPGSPVPQEFQPPDPATELVFEGATKRRIRIEP